MSGIEAGGPDVSPPLVSCIIIFLNEERFLAQAIESVVVQSIDDWELLLVDDGSSDSSAAIAQGFVEQHPDRIRYLSHPDGANRGMSASRNLGIERARGEYLAFLDGDDAWYPDKLAKQVALFRANPEAQMVCGATLYWHSWQNGLAEADHVAFTGEVRRDDCYALDLPQDHLFAPGELVYRLYPLAKGATPSASGYMVRRDLALELGGFENSFRGMFEDQVFRAKVFLAAYVYVSAEVFDRYRQHPESEVHVARRNGRLKTARRQFLEWYRGYAVSRYPQDTRLAQRIGEVHARYFGMRARARQVMRAIGL